MLEQFLNHIQQHQLCTPDNRILLAVSGGVDSVVMLHLFHLAGFTVSAAHCNFQLRGVAADQDEEFVKEICGTTNIPFYSKRFTTTDYAELNNLSVQMAARELRYAWFEELLKTKSFDFVATAHHLNDSIETVLLNWIHGRAAEGLTGIPVKNQKIIRPLLFAKRKTIEEYALAHRLSWREDASNFTNEYSRNFLRHQVLPKLKELNPALEETVQLGMEKLKGDVELEQLGIEHLKSRYLKTSENEVTISKELFENFRHRAPLLWKLIRGFNFTYATCRDVVRALPGQSGKRFLSPTHQLVIDRSLLIITPHENFPTSTDIRENQSSASLGRQNMQIETFTGIAPPANRNVAVLDAATVQFPLVWRTWQPGDYFYPLGMAHKKKISDFLIDLKVPLSDKPHITVLESAGQIIWVVGCRIDNRFKVTDSTKQALQFTVYPHFIG